MAKWSDEEEEILRTGVEAGKTDREIAAMIPGRTLAAVTQKRAYMGLPGGSQAGPTLTRVVSETPERVVYAPEETDEEPIEEVWDRAVRKTRRKREKAATEGLALVQLVTDRPVAISISSDWHITPSGACDLEGLRDYAEAIQQTPGAFAVAVGDLHDNPIKWDRKMEDVPDELRLIDLIFSIFGTKLLGTTDGNHDAWSRQFAGVDNIRALAKRGRIHYAPDELVYVVEILDPKTRNVTAKYVIATRHKYRRHSNLNYTHACWRWLEDRVNQWPQGGDGGTLIPDILAIGDNHVAATESRATPNGPRWAARMGPWQTSTSFGRAKGYATSPPTAPTFVLYPHRAKPIAGFEDYQQALDYLTRERMGAAA
ncbi:MAG TPA: SANT/Myb-like DNA-binding domain-containing protein [Longimicrobiales bacterium]|nr:SANT/Myb-like DNA-binding domain-containing protein [Longimicrobiales bacterium]